MNEVILEITERIKDCNDSDLLDLILSILNAAVDAVEMPRTA